MGLFDRFYTPCPKCGTDIEYQSKAGPCHLASYRPWHNVPIAIAVDLDGQVERCPGCGASIALAASVPQVVRLAAYVKD